MMRKLFAIGLLAVIILPTSARAQDIVRSACITDVYEHISREERMYRSVVLGQKKSADLPIGSVRIDEDFDTWIKTANNAWRSLDHDGLTWSNTLMDEQADVPDRRGLLEIRKTPTSDLIPALAQSVRALQCRLRSVCMAAQDSVGLGEDASLKVQPTGCIEFEFKAFDGCREQSTIADTLANVCDTAIDATLERERKFLELLVTYDAAYRSLMQFSGMFEGFMDDFRFPLLEPLWQAVRALGALDGLPCFSAQCDE